MDIIRLNLNCDITEEGVYKRERNVRTLYVNIFFRKIRKKCLNKRSGGDKKKSIKSNITFVYI